MKIFPKEIIEHSVQHFIPKNTVRSKSIYTLILLILGFGFLSMPFVSIPIYSSARGYIKPSIERVSLTSIHPGRIAFLNFKNGRDVHQGDTIILLETNVLDEQLDLNTKKAKQLSEEIQDLEYLVSEKYRNPKKLMTPKYQKELIAYQSSVTEHYTTIKKLKEDYKRNKKLLAKGVIARAEYEDVKLTYDLAENALYQLQKQQANSWQANLTESVNTKQELENTIQQLLGDKKNYVIKAPIQGTLINAEGLQIGSFVNAGSILGEITPDTELIAECYVSPGDIGLIDARKEVKFQVDAFNYNQWGFLYGKITSIAADVELIENQPTYKIQCRIENKVLYLKNGYQGQIGKGMTLTARFELTERTVYQLLYDKMDDWLNPGYRKNVTLNN
ncbi:hypothetical protein FGF1_38740 [Flavobacteriaceae bacterium GF1]